MNLDIRKEPGSISRHKVARDDMILINRLSKAELTPDQVYTFAIRLCDNEVDRDWERFDEEALEILSGLWARAASLTTTGPPKARPPGSTGPRSAGRAAPPWPGTGAST